MVWRPPLLEEERRLFRNVARLLELAWREDPALDYPWREWQEVLGYLGIKPPSPVGTVVSQAGTLFYFGFFLLMPWWSRIGTFHPVPDRVTYAAH